jgi:hypothetical protein
MDSPAPAPPPAQTNEAAALPDWLRDTPADAPAGAASEQLPAWLRDLAGLDAPEPEPPAPIEAPTPAPPATSLPDWLRDTQGASAPTADTAGQPSWLAEAAETPGSVEPSTPDDQTPGWLGGLTDEPPTDEPATPPEWLSSTSDAEPAAPKGLETPSWLSAERAPEPPTTPDWLSSAGDSGPAAPASPETIDLWGPDPSPPAPAPAQPNSSDAGVPEWLRDISADDADDQITAEPFSFEGATGAQPPAEAAGPPAWLSSGEDTAEAIPEWLRSAVSQSEDLAGAARETPDVPLWLQDAASQPADVPAAPTPAEPSAAPPQPPAAQPAALPPWLSDQSEPPPAADVPPWLQTESEPAAQAPAADVPSWLRDPEPSAQAPAAEVPSWLQTESEPAAQAPAADVPSWLQTESEPAAQAPAADIPSWLQTESEPIAQTPAADVPSWLQESAPQDDASAQFPATQAADPAGGTLGSDLAQAPPADDLPDWLRPSAPPLASDSGPGQDLPPWLRDEAGQPLPTAGVSGDTNLPAWLRGVAAEPPAAPSPAKEPPAPANFDWLDQATESETRRPATESEFFGGTELPAWLRPPEPEQPKESNQADARSLDWLTRLGGPDEVESAAPATVATPRLTPPIARPRSPAQIEALALMERLAATPFPEATPVPAPAQPSAWRRIGIERALYLALLIALLVGLITPLPESFGLTAAATAPGAAELFTQIDKLSENDIVLVGYEWDARRSGELRPLENAVLGHLIQRKVKLVLVSTDPQGTLLLFDFRDQLAAAGYNKNNGGEDYILLGYRPGAELALRSLAQNFRSALMSDFQGSDATKRGTLATDAATGEARLNTLADFSMILVLADEAQDVQGWMEQVQRSARQVPFSFLLPAETTPVVQPYLSQPGIFHLAGAQGALAYQSLRGGSGMPAEQIAREVSQQRLSLLVFVALLLVGAIIIGISAAARRGRSS